MPSQFDHLIRIARNYEFLVRSFHLISNFPEWYITISFYMALHSVNNYLAGQKGINSYFKHPRTHNALNEALIEADFPQDDYINYMTIYQASRIARYFPFRIFKRDYIDTNRTTFLIEIALDLKEKYG